MNNKGFLAAAVLLILSVVVSGCGKGGDEPAPDAESKSGAATPQYTAQEVQNQPETAAPAAVEPTRPEATAPEPTVEEAMTKATEDAMAESLTVNTNAPEPTLEEAMTKATEDAMAESLTVNTDAPIYFMEGFDGEVNDTDWETMYSFLVDEDVEEGDPEATPDFSIDQRRSVLRFDLNSPYLYVYRSYVPYTYQDIRIDMEVENKAANTNNISLFCRSTDYGWYEFIATSGGYYSIVRYYQDGSEELATGGIRSIKFGTDKKNVFTAICQGRTLTYIVNDVEIAMIRDDEIPDAGLAGFNVSAEEYLPVSVEVNWIAFTDPN